MKYSNVVLTDDNFDTELEKLCEFAILSLDSYNNFIDKLDTKFILQQNNDKEEWLLVKGCTPDRGSDFRHTSQRGQLAYEFGNGFIVLDYEDFLV